MKPWIFALAALGAAALAAPLAAARLLPPSEHKQTAFAATPGNLPEDVVVEVPDSEVVADFDAWEVQQSSSLVAALTRNQDGSLFGVMCRKGCSYYVGVGLECTGGDVYTGILAISSGAIPITLRCAHIREEGELYSILLINEDLFDVVADATGNFSVTVPIANNDVSTSHFSMDGAQDAVEEMLRIADDQPESWAPRPNVS